MGKTHVILRRNALPRVHGEFTYVRKATCSADFYKWGLCFKAKCSTDFFLMCNLQKVLSTVSSARL